MADDLDDVLNFDPTKLSDKDLAELEKDLGDTDAMKDELKAMGIDLENFDEDVDIENNPVINFDAGIKKDEAKAEKVVIKTADVSKKFDDGETTEEDAEKKIPTVVSPEKKEAADMASAADQTDANSNSTLSREELLAKMEALKLQHDQLRKSLASKAETTANTAVQPEDIAPEKPVNRRESAPSVPLDSAPKTENRQRTRRKRAVKVIVVGNSKCGKTSIINRYVKNVFSNEYNYTIGCEYSMKEVQVTPERVVRLQLWDIAGQDRFIHLSRAFYKKSAGAILVCDVTRPATMEALRGWKKEIDKDLIEEAKNKGSKVPVIMIANKVDLLPDVKQSIAVGADVQKLSEDLDLDGWFIGSAKADSNISEAMMFLLKKIVGDGKEVVKKENVVVTPSRPKPLAKKATPNSGGRSGRAHTIDLSKPSGELLKNKKGPCCIS